MPAKPEQNDPALQGRPVNAPRRRRMIGAAGSVVVLVAATSPRLDDARVTIG